jgi:hypothetical protein
MMKKKLICLFLIFIVIITGACGKKSAQSYDKASSRAPANNAEQKAVATGEVDFTSNNTAVQDTVQKIIQNYDIYIEVEDLKKTAGEIENKVKLAGGYLENEEVMDASCYALARVPSNNLENFVKDIEKNYNIINKTKNTQNITDVYVDNDARLRNLKAEEVQMYEVLKKAGTVEDILKVQSELYRIRGEIEVLESKKKVWDKQVDYSTVSIRMNKKQTSPNRFISIISGNEFVKSLYRGFANSFLYLVLAVQKILIFIVSNIFILVILAALSIYIYKKYKKIKK